MCQRIIIAMALAHQPRLLITDEPTAGLDVTVQRQVLDLMMRLVRHTNAALLLMTRDLGVIAHYVERVLVLERGQIIEAQPVDSFFQNPIHSHSRHLLRASFAAHGEETTQ
jgi:ABC-type dipeptide/oligopeptide/nickel transport system ATPase component